MNKRYVVIWFPHLAADWFCKRHPALKNKPFVLAVPSHGRLIVAETSEGALQKGITPGMSVADARAFFLGLEVFNITIDTPSILKNLCLWCIRFTPVAAIDLPDTIILDATGCAHLWDGEEKYLKDIFNRLQALGYKVCIAIADTIGAAWAVSHYGKPFSIIEQGTHASALQHLPPAALRLDIAAIGRLHKLGLVEISHLLSMPRSALRRRFGEHLLKHIDQALGREEEIIQPVLPVEPYCERLPCLEPIATRPGIEIALQKLLEGLCYRLQKKGKGLREAVLKCYRVDGQTEEISIGTHQPSNNTTHLFRLFELKLKEIEPALGIELFTLEAPKVEEATAKQEKLWAASGGLEDKEIAELLDRLKGKLAGIQIKRYLPTEHYWPERSFRVASSLEEKTETNWRKDKQRPVQLLPKPDKILVTAPIPDYPPMLFSYQGKLRKVIKADGPERIEPEWWIAGGLHRDYYAVEDEEGKRYWIFREGYYGSDKKPSWYIHGFFA